MKEIPAESSRCSPGWDAFSEQHRLTCCGGGGVAEGAPQTIFLSALGKI